MNLLRTTYPKARKEHQCEFCFSIIKQDEEHQCQTIVNDGTIETLRVCKRCEGILGDMFDVGYVDHDGCIGLDLFQEYVHENNIYLDEQ